MVNDERQTPGGTYYSSGTDVPDFNSDVDISGSIPYSGFCRGRTAFYPVAPVVDAVNPEKYELLDDIGFILWNVSQWYISVQDRLTTEELDKFSEIFNRITKVIDTVQNSTIGENSKNTD